MKYQLRYYYFFRDISAFKTHMKRHEDPDNVEKEHHCGHCGKGFSSKESLRVHVQRYCQNDIILTSCALILHQIDIGLTHMMSI